MKPLLFIFLIFSMCSCSPRENEFEHYLRKMKIPLQENNMYLLIPGEQCGGCFSYDVSNLPDDVQNNLVLINAHAKATLKNFKTIYVDKDDDLYSLSFLKHTNTLLVSKDHHLSYVRVYHLNHQLDSMYHTMFPANKSR